MVGLLLGYGYMRCCIFIIRRTQSVGNSCIYRNLLLSAFSLSTIKFKENFKRNYNLKNCLNQIIKMTSPGPHPVTIGTHSGVFHCDEVLACVMLKQLPHWANAKIIRSRDMDVLKECSIVVDVGGIFDHSKLRYDHHQKTFKDTLSDLRPELGDRFKITRLSSAGLVYTYYGDGIINEILKRNGVKLPGSSSDNVEFIQKIFVKVYENFIQEIDAIDNGVEMYEGVEPRYRISTNLSARVGGLNPAWNESGKVDEMQQFEKAMDLVLPEFIDKIMYYACQWWPARSIVVDAIQTRFDVYSSGEIIKLSQQCPWKSHLFEIEKEMNIVGQIKYALDDNKPGDCRVICVPVSESSFLSRKPLPEQWRGLVNQELAEASGVSDAVFCHATGFIAGCKSYNGVYQMAEKSLTLW